MTPIKTLEEAKKELLYVLPNHGAVCACILCEWKPRILMYFESTLSSLTEQMIPEEKIYTTRFIGSPDPFYEANKDGYNQAIKEMQAKRKELLKK